MIYKIQAREEHLSEFEKVGQDQRGKPEEEMLKFQKAFGGGILPYALEHAGDLIHRMTHKAAFDYFGLGEVREKTNRLYDMLTNGYGFRKEVRENLENNAEWYGIDPEEFRAKLDDMKADYVKAHEDLTTYNKLHFIANRIPINIGMEQYKRAVLHLHDLQNIVEDKDRFYNMAKVAFVDEDGSLLEYEPKMEDKAEILFEPARVFVGEIAMKEVPTIEVAKGPVSTDENDSRRFVFEVPESGQFTAEFTDGTKVDVNVDPDDSEAPGNYAMVGKSNGAILEVWENKPSEEEVDERLSEVKFFGSSTETADKDGPLLGKVVTLVAERKGREVEMEIEVGNHFILESRGYELIKFRRADGKKIFGRKFANFYPQGESSGRNIKPGDVLTIDGTLLMENGYIEGYTSELSSRQETSGYASWVKPLKRALDRHAEDRMPQNIRSMNPVMDIFHTSTDEDANYESFQLIFTVHEDVAPDEISPEDRSEIVQNVRELVEESLNQDVNPDDVEITFQRGERERSDENVIFVCTLRINNADKYSMDSPGNDENPEPSAAPLSPGRKRRQDEPAHTPRKFRDIRARLRERNARSKSEKSALRAKGSVMWREQGDSGLLIDADAGVRCQIMMDEEDARAVLYDGVEVIETTIMILSVNGKDVPDNFDDFEPVEVSFSKGYVDVHTLPDGSKLAFDMELDLEELEIVLYNDRILKTGIAVHYFNGETL